MVERTGVPVVWKTSQEVADRLLGKTGRPVLEQNIQLAQEAAAREKWPLKRLQLEHWQDEELPGWEMIRVVLVFDAPPTKAKTLLDQFVGQDVRRYQDSLKSKRVKDLFIRRITYDFESR